MIFYLSCTGNTRWAAGKIAETTGEQLVNIAEAMDGDCCFELADGERIGFCFPVHGWRPPQLVRQFIKKLTLKSRAHASIDTNGNGKSNALNGTDYSAHYTFALCTTGDNIGEAMDILQHDLRQKGLQAASTFTLLMPESYVGLPFMDVDKPEKEQEKISTAAHKLNKCCHQIATNTCGIHDNVVGRWPRINSRVIGSFFVRHLIKDKPFHVVGERCTRCGMCAKVCPVANIDGGRGQEPSWQHNGRCLTCFACYHHCPNHAIEFGSRTKKKGQYFYRHQPSNERDKSSNDK